MVTQDLLLISDELCWSLRKQGGHESGYLHHALNIWLILVM